MDNTLQNTLTGTMATPQPAALPQMPAGLTVPETLNTPESLDKDISKLQAAQQSPTSLVNFQNAMRLSSQLAYKDRQTTELGTASKQFDPTKVSGGTFASIIQNLESQRGADIGKIYASTMNAYGTAQEQITNRLQFMQQLQESRKQFEAELKMKKDQLKLAKKESKQAYKAQKKQLEQQQSNWEREFALSAQKAKASTSASGVYGDLGISRAAWDEIKNNSRSSVSTNSSTSGLTFDPGKSTLSLPNRSYKP